MSNQDTIKKLGAVINENLPHILTGVATIGVVATSAETAKAVIRVKKLDEDNADERPASDKAKSVIKSFIPAIITGALTIGCIISSDVVHTKRYTSLLGAFMLAKSEAPKLKNKVVEMVGPEKAKEIEHAVKSEEIKKLEAGSKLDETSKYMKYRVVDLVTGATFKSSYAALLRGEAAVAKEVARTGNATLEWFYGTVTDEVDYPEIATRIYWDQEQRRDLMDLRIDANVTSDGEVYLTIDYEYNTR